MIPKQIPVCSTRKLEVSETKEIENITNVKIKSVQTLLKKTGRRLIASFLKTTKDAPQSRTRSRNVSVLAKNRYNFLYCKFTGCKKYKPHRTEFEKSLSAMGSSRAPISDSACNFLAKYPSNKSLKLPKIKIKTIPSLLPFIKKQKKKGMLRILSILKMLGIDFRTHTSLFSP